MESPVAESILFLICYVLYCVMKRYHKEAKEILMLALPSVICLAVTMNTFYQMNPGQICQPQIVPGCCGRTE